MNFVSHQPYQQIHETCIKICDAIRRAYNQIHVKNSSIRNVDGVFHELAAKYKHDKEILYMAIARLQKRHIKQVEKLRYSYLDESDVYDLAVERLDNPNPNPDRIHDFAVLMGLIYDEDLGFYYDPEELL